MVTNCSAYAKGDTCNDHNTFFGNATTISIFMRRTRLWRQNMILAIYLRLEDEMNIVACLDNNQKGHPMKYQRFGKSNRFVKVTGCVLKKFYSNTRIYLLISEFLLDSD